MSKAGLNIMTQSLAVEWGSKNIRFNAIAPGPFPTEGAWARLNPSSSDTPSRSAGDSSAPGNPMGRVGRMPELANLAIYLFAPGSEYVNGQTIAIDGAAHQAGGGGFSRLRDWTDEQWESARAAIQGANQRDRAKRTV
jgi:NAD(P)-dependent dehydrogenase (short-subunit alcohol dehydrogenase family)